MITLSLKDLEGVADGVDSIQGYINIDENVLEKYPNSADAHYGIGVIYEKQGNLVKARAEWRQTLKIQVNHQGALQKLNSN